MKNILLLLACFMVCRAIAQPSRRHTPYYLIAHRGGVVDSLRAENSLPALLAAIDRGYRMVEIDLRVTKDSVLIIQHDADFKQYYGLDQRVTETTWQQASQLRSNTGGSRVLQLEEVFQQCQGKIAVMIDNKVQGFDSGLFSKVLHLLKKYGLDKDAMMIGTDESTVYFTGKIRLSCTRQQLEENKLKPGYRPGDYYLFGSDLSAGDVAWARQQHILAVGVVNAWRYKHSPNAFAQAAQDAEKLKKTGLQYFQVDAEYDRYFFHK